MAGGAHVRDRRRGPLVDDHRGHGPSAGAVNFRDGPARSRGRRPRAAAAAGGAAARSTAGGAARRTAPGPRGGGRESARRRYGEEETLGITWVVRAVRAGVGELLAAVTAAGLAAGWRAGQLADQRLD